MEKLLNDFVVHRPIGAARGVLTDETPVAEAPASGPSTPDATAGPDTGAFARATAEPIELGQVPGAAVLKRVIPLFGGLVILLIALRRLRK